MAILAKQKKLEISNGNQLKRIVEKNVAINFIIMKLKDFIYNKKTKESNLLGVLFVVVVTIVSGAVLYYGFWI